MRVCARAHTHTHSHYGNFSWAVAVDLHVAMAAAPWLRTGALAEIASSQVAWRPSVTALKMADLYAPAAKPAAAAAARRCTAARARRRTLSLRLAVDLHKNSRLFNQIIYLEALMIRRG